MSNFHLEYLNRDAYLLSISTITDTKTFNFAKMSLTWWDERFKWRSNGCVALCDKENNHLSYLFFTIDHYRAYLLIHNLFTPLAMRRNGYAFAILNEVFNIAIQSDIKRFKLSSISQSLDFYLSIGFIYWGLTSTADYYCDLPIPLKGLKGLKQMIRENETRMLLGNTIEKIYDKVNQNHQRLNQHQMVIYEEDKIKMGSRYLFDFLIAQKKLE